MIRGFFPNVARRRFANVVLLVLMCSLPMAPLVHATSVSKVLPRRQLRQQRVDMHTLLGRHAILKGRNIGAIRHLEAAAQESKYAAEIYDQISELYLFINDPFKALGSINQALDTDDTIASRWAKKAGILNALQQKELAVESMQEAIKRDPSNGRYYFDLGVWQAEQGKFQEASVSSFKAIELDYDSAAAYNNYGYALTHTGDYEKAHDAIDRALKSEGDTPSAALLDSKGYIHFKENELDEALKWYDKALDLNPELSDVYLHKAEALEAQGKTKQAIDAYLAFLRFSQGDEAQIKSIADHLTSLREQVAKDYFAQQDAPPDIKTDGIAAPALELPKLRTD
jgi:tetratricopeptide (TPR) repeat protein